MINKKIAIVFPGQGSQRLGMAKDFVEQYQESRDIFELASETLGYDMQTLCFSDEVKLNNTEFMQPAILTAEIAMFAVIAKTLKQAPVCFAGHSMGEYTALVAAGVLPFTDAVKLVQGRSALMQHAVAEGSGTMVALIQEAIDATDFEKRVVDSGAELANYNSPNQVVIAGLNSSIDLACETLAAAYPSMRIVRLDITLPFHSSHMQSVEPELDKYLRVFESNMNLSNANLVLSNLTGVFHSNENLITNLVKQISGCVQWRKNIETITTVADEVLEIGPNRVLGRLCNDCGLSAKSVINVRSLQKYLAG